ncbi:transmembrane protein 26-like [Myxocyprinus asiaticus]|uniref:transmembrane protein 26-like n=1 Tax=Myxocyprinus asiaticus TaxID=70543 RepID=UPI0022226F5A|nr:transmembrane protein 26-like [Myxocyprinus asiaticus]
MILVKFVCAIITRSLFILVSLIGVWRVTTVKNDIYWLLTFLHLPLVVEMIITLKRRKGKGYKWKLDSLENVKSIVAPLTGTMDNKTPKHLEHSLTSVCLNDWILGLHQVLLILLIFGKWLLPLGEGVTCDELSQLLLIFIGTGADILEFTSETVSDVKDSSPQLVYIILAVWMWSVLQFPLHLAG